MTRRQAHPECRRRRFTKKRSLKPRLSPDVDDVGSDGFWRWTLRGTRYQARLQSEPGPLRVDFDRQGLVKRPCQRVRAAAVLERTVCCVIAFHGARFVGAQTRVQADTSGRGSRGSRHSVQPGRVHMSVTGFPVKTGARATPGIGRISIDTRNRNQLGDHRDNQQPDRVEINATHRVGQTSLQESG